MLNEQPLVVKPQADVMRLDLKNFLATRNLLFVLFLVASVIIYWAPLKNLAALSLGQEEYSYIGMMPPLALFLFYIERKKIFQNVHYSLGAGALLLLAAVILNLASASASLGQESYLFLKILSLVTAWVAGFACFYGSQTLRTGAFPLLFVLLILPLPHFVIEKPLVVIQHGSAEVVNMFLILTAVPFFRDGLRFSLPGLDVEVAPQCSGIHSTLALLIGSLLVGHFYIKSGWRRALLVVLVFPIVNLTNGFRIYGLSVLAVYVSMSFFKGDLHRNGGVLFFLLGLILLACAAKLLRNLGRGRRADSKA